MSNKGQRPATEANGSMLVWWVKRCQMNYSLRIYHLLKYCILISSKDITYYVQICLFIFIQIEYYLKTDFLFKNNFYSKLIGKCGLDSIKKHTVPFQEIFFYQTPSTANGKLSHEKYIRPQLFGKRND